MFGECGGEFCFFGGDVNVVVYGDVKVVVGCGVV